MYRANFKYNHQEFFKGKKEANHINPNAARNVS